MQTLAANLPSPAGPARRPWPVFLLVLGLLLAAAPEPAAAQSLDQYRANGQIGERFDGYLMATRQNASSKIQKTVRSVNAQRRDIYRKRAKQQGVPTAQVGRVYAKQILGKAPRGTWFLRETGKWAQK